MQEDYEIIKKIEQLYDLSRYQQVINLCMKYLYSDSEYAEYLYYYCIQSYLALDNHIKAEVMIKEALSKFPNTSWFYAHYARVYSKRLNYQKALKYVDKAISLDIESSYNLYLKATILSNSNNEEKAKEVILKALKSNPNDLDYLNIYAMILYNLQDNKYKEIINKMLELDPNNTEALYLKGFAKNSLSGNKKGLLSALKINPFDKDYKSAYKNNKRDFSIFILSLIVAIGLNVAYYFIDIPKSVVYVINILLFSLAVHLSYYFKETYFLMVLIWIPLLDGILVVRMIGAVLLAYFSTYFATFVKSSLLNFVEALKQGKTLIKYSNKQELKEIVVSNILYIILFISSCFVFIDFPQEYKDFFTGLFFGIIVFSLVVKRKFSFTLLFQSFIILFLFRAISILILSEILVSFGLQSLHFIIVIILALIYTITIKKL